MIIKPLMAAVVALSLGALPAAADTLDLNNSQAVVDANAPQRGMSMQRVESKWGQPARRVAAVGQPPITRWEYDGFTVYFEYDKVIHSVATR
ncbi:MAG: hypothetical protein AAAFM81_07205 [Pseudomonadota bacterium]